MRRWTLGVALLGQSLRWAACLEALAPFGDDASTSLLDAVSLVQSAVAVGNGSSIVQLAEAYGDWGRHRRGRDAPSGKRRWRRSSSSNSLALHRKADEMIKSMTVTPKNIESVLEHHPPVLTVLNRARLGNRLFQWAALMSIAAELGVPAIIPEQRYKPEITPQMSKLGPLIWSESDYQSLSEHEDKCHTWDQRPITISSGLESLTQWTRPNQLKGKQFHRAPAPTAETAGNLAGSWAKAIKTTPTPSPCSIVQLDGFFMNQQFFSKHMDVIRQAYWNEDVAERARLVMGKLLGGHQPKGGAIVALHFRLGDYVKTARNLDQSYYREALELVKQRTHATQLTCLVFSDDIELAQKFSSMLKDCTRQVPVMPVKETIGGKVFQVDDKVSFYMMSQSPNIIIADSTYSFWAARLAPHEPLVIVPKTGSPDLEYLVQTPGWESVDAHTGGFVPPEEMQGYHFSRSDASVANSEWGA